jgi:hypothetical protein
MWKWKRRRQDFRPAAFSFSHAKRISAVFRPNLALSPVESAQRPSPRLRGDPDDVVYLRELLDDEDHALAELAADERQADVVVVLVAVADDHAARARVHRQGDHELGLGAGLQAVVVVLAGLHDLVDHLPQLVHLDREHPPVLALVALLLDGLDEDLVQLDHPVAQEVLEADHQRGLEPHPEGLVDHVEDAYAAPVGQGLDVDEALRVDGEVAGAPALEPVELLGFCCRPGG